MKHLYIISIFILFLACEAENKNSDIEGVWISAYQIDLNNKNLAYPETTIIGIKNNEIEIQNIGDPKDGFYPTNIKTTFNRHYFGIEIDNYEVKKIYLDKITKDSLVVSYNLESKNKEVFRKVKAISPQLNWKPENKSYKWKGNKTTVYSDFFKNGLFVHYNKQDEDVHIGHWHTFKMQNAAFLSTDIIAPITLTIDSLKDKEVYLSIFEKEKFNYKFTEQSLAIPDDLIGEWALVSTEVIGDNPPPPSPPGELERMKMNFIKIENDTIRYEKNKTLLNKKWVLGGAADLLIFPDIAMQNIDSLKMFNLTKQEHQMRKNIWKIDSLSATELILKTEYILWNFTKKLKYTRK
jgi:hypothetical protein